MRWILTIFIGLCVLTSAIPWLQKLGIGRLPGDLYFKVFGHPIQIPLASTILLFSVGLWFGRKQKNLYYLATIPFATLMILLTTFISHSNLKNVNLFLFAGIIVITGTTLIIYFILHLKRQWYGTEE